MAPPTTDGSATLNTGHQPTDKKSTTCPRSGPGARKKRSTRLPMAPPRIIPRPSAHHGDTSRRPIQKIPTTTPVAISVKTQVYPVAIEKAAPELRTRVQVTVSPIIDTGWPGGNSWTATTLVTMSSVSTTTATDSSMRSRRGGAGALGSPAPPASSVEVSGSADPVGSSGTPSSSPRADMARPDPAAGWEQTTCAMIPSWPASPSSLLEGQSRPPPAPMGCYGQPIAGRR
ncbi:Uncharacterised protein [Mycobacterium tuberculosis]|nr:Uncharacterised protein [Mycobacterium tuberculosis]CNV52523.1 Uncharacterised protein [Mycobacterium tuberculosis]SGP02918.1 Uncharacterised protein [Mycobacterium tuberculosis]